jgi:hypothetical protein
MNIKNRIGAYVDIVYKISSDKRLKQPEVVPAILKQIEGASVITGLSEENLLRGLDFKPKDKTVSALESFLAELRVVHLLHELGFENIQPIEATGLYKTPDFEAVFHNKTCAIEVFCLPAEFGQLPNESGLYRNFDPEFAESKFGKKFFDKAAIKKLQLDSIVAEAKIVLCVVNHSCICALSTNVDVRVHAEFLSEKLNWGMGYHVGLLCGGFGCIEPKFV